MGDEQTNILPCGHADTFEHGVVQGFLQLVDRCDSVGIDAVGPCMEYVTELFRVFNLPIPTAEEIEQVNLLLSANAAKGVN
jgi:hypothetical protein